MSKLSRRETLAGGGKVIAAAAVAMTAGVSAKAAQSDPLREGVQALVNEIRQGLKGKVGTETFQALMETADWLEALPGIQPIPNEFWERYWKPGMAHLPGGRAWSILRPPLAGGAS